MLEKSQYTNLPLRPSKKRVQRIIRNTVQYITLFGVMILLAGHENNISNIGKKNSDLYAKECKYLIKIHTTPIFTDSLQTVYCDIAKQVNYLTGELYKQRDYSPLWTNNFNTTPNFDTLIQLLESAKFLGFPEDYFNLEALTQFNQKLINNTENKENLKLRVALEVQATRSAVLFAVYLKHGILNKAGNDCDSSIKYIPQTLNKYIERGNLRVGFTAFEPKLEKYTELKTAFPSLISLINLVKNTRPELLHDSLLANSLYYASVIDSIGFDSINTRINSIKRFQKSYRLKPDGKLNPATYQKLTGILEYRYYQVCLNLDRLRKTEDQHGNFLFVNIPEFKLFVLDNHKIFSSYRVIVGKKQSPTPQLSSNIHKIIANPFWTVPRSITKNEMLDKIRKDSSFLTRNGYYIIDNGEDEIAEESIDWDEPDPLGKDLWIRQKNSRGNALGQIKFLFPNKYSVYLHDTPSKRLFKKRIRAYSHGCIRLENPDRLAQYLTDKLYSTEKDSIRITKVIRSRKRKEILLRESIPIHIKYITCSANAGGQLSFFGDLYRKDTKEINMLFPVDIGM